VKTALAAAQSADRPTRQPHRSSGRSGRCTRWASATITLTCAT